MEADTTSTEWLKLDNLAEMGTSSPLGILCHRLVFELLLTRGAEVRFLTRREFDDLD